MTSTPCTTRSPNHNHLQRRSSNLPIDSISTSSSSSSSSSASSSHQLSGSRPCRSPKRVKSTPSPRLPAQLRSHHSHSQPRGLSSAGSINNDEINSSSYSSSGTHRRVPACTKSPEETVYGNGASFDGQDFTLAKGFGMGVRTMYAATSPCRSPGLHEGGWSEKTQRRREMSVPLLSQTLSHFSLSQSTPPLSTTSPQALPQSLGSAQFASPFNTTTTPRCSIHPPPPLATTPSIFACAELVYPNTAPLPSLPNFLGSPFNTKSRGDHFYHLSNSPIAFRKQRESESLSTAIEQQNSEMSLELGIHSGSAKMGGNKHRSEWLEEETEWIADRTFVSNERGSEPFLLRSYTSSSGCQGRPRRDTSASLSSVDDFSGSGTSTSSLPSLVRQLGDQNPSYRHNFIHIWGDDSNPTSRLMDEDDVQPATPNQHLSPKTEGGIHLTSLSDLASPLLSPLVNKRSLLLSTTGTTADSASESPFVHQRMTSSATVNLPVDIRTSPSSPDTKHLLSKSPFANLLPRLIGSRVMAEGRLKKYRNRFTEEVANSHEDTDTEDAGATVWGSPIPRTSTEKKRDDEELGQMPPGIIGLGIYRASPSDPSSPLRHSPKPSSPNSPPAPTSTYRANACRRTFHNSADRVTPTLVPSQARPTFRRGVTEPHLSTSQSQAVGGFDTPPPHVFGDVKPSPAAFTSTGLVKKKGASLNIPNFGDVSRPLGKPMSCSTLLPLEKGGAGEADLDSIFTCPSSPLSPMKNVDASLSLHRGRRSISGVVLGPQQIPKSRGLRRKGSTMFNTSSGSIGNESTVERLSSPATPTKSFVPSLTVGVSTPSPTSTASLYPFAPSTTMSLSSPTDTMSATNITPVVAGPVPRVQKLIRGPIARTSNPMLSAAYYASAPSPSSIKDKSNSSIFKPLDSKKDANGGLIEDVRLSRLERDFYLIQPVGSGEFSKVWKVKEKATGKLWAVKAGKPYSGVKNRLRQLEEASILRQLSLSPHPHVIEFIDSWEQQGRLYIRTELAECGDLARFLLALSDNGGLDEARVWKTLVELSSALGHIHSVGFLHLDLKPSNVLITSTGSLKIGDFGMSIVLPIGTNEDDLDNGNGLTVNRQGSNHGGHKGVGSLSPALPQSGPDGKFVWNKEGTVPSPILDREHEGDREYLCPEALEETTPGTAADVYSLGIMLLEAALNVVLPSNGDGWVKLRNDDFSDLDEHYTLRPRLIQMSNTVQTRASTQLSRSLLSGTNIEDSINNSGNQDDLTLAGAGVAVLSEELMIVIKRMMCCDPLKRMTLRQLNEVECVRRAREAMERGKSERIMVDCKAHMVDGQRRANPAALVEEDEEFLNWLLARTKS